MSEESKTILLTIDFPPVIGGISTYLYELVRNLSATQLNVIGLNATNSEQFDSKQKFQIIRINLPFGWKHFSKQLKFLAPFYYIKLMKTKNIKALICGQAHYSILLPAWLYSKIYQCQYGVFAYGLDLLHPQKKIYANSFNFLLRSAHFIIVDSQAAAEITGKLGIENRKIHILHPSISPLKEYAENRFERVPILLNNLANKKLILTVSRLVERKGHDTIIYALPKILNKVPNAHYMIVGTGAEENKLKQQVKRLNLEGHVTFFGFIPEKELSYFYEACDVFSMISREIHEKGDIEGFGIVYLEANQYGKPVVAGNSGGVKDAVIHNKTGLLIEPDNPDAAADAITHLLLDSEYAKKLGAQGKERVTNEFNSSISAQRLQAILDQVVR